MGTHALVNPLIFSWHTVRDQSVDHYVPEPCVPPLPHTTPLYAPLHVYYNVLSSGEKSERMDKQRGTFEAEFK